MKLMDEPTKNAFIQSFTVPSMANEQGVPRVELNNMATNRP